MGDMGVACAILGSCVCVFVIILMTVVIMDRDETDKGTAAAFAMAVMFIILGFSCRWLCMRKREHSRPKSNQVASFLGITTTRSMLTPSSMEASAPPCPIGMQPPTEPLFVQRVEIRPPPSFSTFYRQCEREQAETVFYEERLSHA